MHRTNQYVVMDEGDARPWGRYDSANFDYLFNMMPTRGTTLVDATSVPNAHKHRRLFDENSIQRAEMATALFTVNVSVQIDNALTVDAGAVFNEDGGDNDFRVESQNDEEAFFVQGNTGFVGVGREPAANAHLEVYDATVNTADTYYGIYNYHVKTAGATDNTDQIFGFYNRITFNQAAGILSKLYSNYNVAVLTLGTVDNILGSYGESQVDAGTVTVNLYGIYAFADLNAGTIAGDAYGLLVSMDQEAANTIGGDGYAAYIHADYDGTVTGTAYGLFVDAESNVDYLGVFRAGASGAAYLANSVVTIENSDTALLTFLVPNGSGGGVVVGSPADNDAGQMVYVTDAVPAAGYWDIYAGAVNIMNICSVGVTIDDGGAATTARARLDVIQNSTTGAVPCIYLDQDDVDQEFMTFNGTVAADQSTNISTQNVGGTHTSGNCSGPQENWQCSHMVRVNIAGVGDKWIALFQGS